MATHSTVLAWRIPWTKPGRLQSIGLHRVEQDWSDLPTNPPFRKLKRCRNLWPPELRTSPSRPLIILHECKCIHKIYSIICDFLHKWHHAEHILRQLKFLLNKHVFGFTSPAAVNSGLPGGSVVKNLPAMQEMWVWSLDWKDPLEKGMASHSSILAWEIPWVEEPGGLQSMESQELDMTEYAHTHVQKAPRLCYYAFSSDLMTKSHHFCSLPSYMLLKPPLPHCCCLVPIFSSLNKSNTVLIPLSLSAQLAPHPRSVWLIPWAISKFLPDLFTLPLLKIGHGCPRLFRQYHNPRHVLWSPVAFGLNTSPVSAHISPNSCHTCLLWSYVPQGLCTVLFGWSTHPSSPWTSLLLLSHFHIISESPSHRSFFFLKWILF